jgi:hypothetical protein
MMAAIIAWTVGVLALTWIICNQVALVRERRALDEAERALSAAHEIARAAMDDLLAARSQAARRELLQAMAEEQDADLAETLHHNA